MIKQVKKSQGIIEYLNQNHITNLNILGILQNRPDAEIFSDSCEKPEGVLVRWGYFNYVYTESDWFLAEMLNTLFCKESHYGFSGVSRPIAEKIKQRFTLDWENNCHLYYLPKENLDLTLIKNPVRSISLEDAEIIDHFYTYRGENSLQDIKECITLRPSSAVYVDDNIASWVLLHDDNSMGIMYTKEEYRKMGYAVDVTIDLCKRVLEVGNTPFLHIVEGNNMSPGLALKCGFLRHGYSDWFGIKRI